MFAWPGIKNKEKSKHIPLLILSVILCELKKKIGHEYNVYYSIHIPENYIPLKMLSVDTEHFWIGQHALESVLYTCVCI